MCNSDANSASAPHTSHSAKIFSEEVDLAQVGSLFNEEKGNRKQSEDFQKELEMMSHGAVGELSGK
ncbi:hypothetical protein IMZ48_02630 [Candidatus Bathyarchaeota archaeon]|nr:hypothetical protein [Candidatus Bathyarchaeota archaeon]